MKSVRGVPHDGPTTALALDTRRPTRPRASARDGRGTRETRFRVFGDAKVSRLELPQSPMSWVYDLLESSNATRRKVYVTVPARSHRTLEPRRLVSAPSQPRTRIFNETQFQKPARSRSLSRRTGTSPWPCRAETSWNSPGPGRLVCILRYIYISIARFFFSLSLSLFFSRACACVLGSCACVLKSRTRAVEKIQTGFSTESFSSSAIACSSLRSLDTTCEGLVSRLCPVRFGLGSVF